MKKFIVLVAALLAALFIVGCASKPAAPSEPSASDLLASAKGNAPSGVLVGQAIAKQGSREDSIRRAEQNAALQIIRAIQYIAGEMIDEQVTSGRLSASVVSDFKTTINTALSRTGIDAVKVESGAGAGDTGYAVSYLDKAGTLKVFNSAVTASKESVSGTRNFNNDNFDAVFARAAAREWK